jgi:hypothetical protein
MMHYADPKFISEGFRRELRYTEPVCVGEGIIKFSLQYQDIVNDQGVSVEVIGGTEGSEVSMLRYYCYDHDPHYFYGPESKGDRKNIDKITDGDPVEWMIGQLENRFKGLAVRAGYPEIANTIDIQLLGPMISTVGITVRQIAINERSTVKHNRGDLVLDAGPVRFGVEDRVPGIAIHVLGDVMGEEIELLAFDCFEIDPHYHYGPRNKNKRLYLDTVANPDPLNWCLGLLKGGKLAPMLQHAGYHDHAARLNPVVLASTVIELEKVAKEMRLAWRERVRSEQGN